MKVMITGIIVKYTIRIKFRRENLRIPMNSIEVEDLLVAKTLSPWKLLLSRISHRL
jgi:hypothetical protein